MKVKIMNRFPNLNDYTKMNSMIMKLNMNINTSVAAIYARNVIIGCLFAGKDFISDRKKAGQCAFKRIPHFVQGRM